MKRQTIFPWLTAWLAAAMVLMTGCGGGGGGSSSGNGNNPAAVPVVSVATGWDHTLALKADSTLWAWGTNSRGQLGLNDTTDHYTPVQVGSESGWPQAQRVPLDLRARV